MDISLEARTVLVLLNSFEQKATLSTLEAIRTHDVWTRQGNDDAALTKVLNQLVDGGLVSCTGTAYSLTRQGVTQVKHFMSVGYSAIMVAAAQSATSRKFCEEIYGLDLCQFNTMNMTQLDKLLEVMNLSEDDYILDLGCGVGLISEYISDVTGASMMGVDFAAGAIELAQERSRPKRSRLSYQVMDIDELSLPGKSFSGVISVDALHIVNDLRKVIQLAKMCLQENGQMGILYSVTLFAEETRDNLAPEQTPLAKALQSCGLNFETWDFTQDERRLWEKILPVAEELRQAYEAEGKLYLYETTVADAQTMLDAVKAGRRSRYLYHIG